MAFRICAFCGGRIAGKRLHAEYCSSRCREAAWRKESQEKAALSPKFIFPCPVCGDEIRTNNARKKFCSAKCNVQAQNARRETTKDSVRVCPHCGVTFSPLQKRGVGRTYCSVACCSAYKYAKKKARRAGKGFTYRFKNKWGGNWAAALQEANFTCRLCGLKRSPSQWGARSPFEVHHLDCSGERENPNHALDNLLVLCKKCHKMFHTQINLVWRDGVWCVEGEVFHALGLLTVPVAKT